MSAYSRPGVFVEETLNPLATGATNSTNAIAAFIGAADKGPVVPTLVSTWSEYTALFGSWNTVQTNALPFAVNAFFNNIGGPALILRVAAAGAVVATRIVKDRTVSSAPTTLTVNAISPGAWGNSISFDILDSTYTTTATVVTRFDLVIRYGGATASNVVERFTDLSMDTASGRYFANVINGRSQYITVVDALSGSTPPINLPALTNNVSLATGADGGAPASSLLVSTAIAQLVDYFRPLVVNLPGVTTATEVNGMLAWAEARGDAFIVIDSTSDATSTAVATAQTLAATYTASSYGAIYSPYLTIPDPLNPFVPGATRNIPPGSSAVGQLLRTDASRGVFKAAAGINNRVAGIVAPARRLTDAELDLLNIGTSPSNAIVSAPPINAIKYVPGAGICIWGARTLKPGFVDKYIPVRRSLIELRKNLIQLTQFAVFEPNDQRLWQKINDVSSAYLLAFWQAGGLKGQRSSDAFFVKCDAALNTTQVIDAGEVHLEVGVALQRPAEYLIIRIGQFEGGTSASDV